MEEFSGTEYLRTDKAGWKNVAEKPSTDRGRKGTAAFRAGTTNPPPRYLFTTSPSCILVGRFDRLSMQFHEVTSSSGLFSPFKLVALCNN